MSQKAHESSVSTRRRHPAGRVHEMADRGVGTLCGTELPEPWEWTNDPTDCKKCQAKEATWA